jgi:hypothetical protein
VRHGLILLPFLALAVCAVNAGAEQSAQPFPEVLFQRQFLTARSWKADEALDFATRNWPTYAEKQGFEDKTVLRRTTVNVLGSPFTAEFRVFKYDATQEVAVFGRDYGEAFCSTLFDWAIKNLGEPAKILEWTETSAVRTVTNTWSEKDADWAIGQGRVRIGCSGLKIGDGYVPALSTLIYRHQAQLKPLEDLVYIECSSTQKYVGKLSERSTEESAPLSFIVDPNRQKILRRDRSPFLETTTFSGEEILASKEQEKGTNTFRLDRITGGYQWTTRLKGDTSTGMDRWGKCVRIEPGKKF